MYDKRQFYVHVQRDQNTEREKMTEQQELCDILLDFDIDEIDSNWNWELCWWKASDKKRQ